MKFLLKENQFLQNQTKNQKKLVMIQKLKHQLKKRLLMI